MEILQMISFSIACLITARACHVNKLPHYFWSCLLFWLMLIFINPTIVDNNSVSSLPFWISGLAWVCIGIAWLSRIGSQILTTKTQELATKQPTQPVNKTVEIGDVIQATPRGHVAQMGALRFGLDFRDNEYTIELISLIEDELYEGLFLHEGDPTDIKCQVVVGSDSTSKFMKSVWPLDSKKYFSQNKFIDRTLKDTEATVPELLKIHKANIIK